jgi:uncharacterized protein with HEPN domain
MAKARPVRLRLLDILDAIHGVQTALAETTYDEYLASAVLQRATERWLEIISEATRFIPDELRARAPEIPWVDIALFGNKTRHEYQSISAKRIWTVAIDDLPPLKAVVERFYGEVKRPVDPWPDAKPPDQG